MLLIVCCANELTLVCFPDVIGVCKSVADVTRLTTKNNREVSKRTLNLMDQSGKLVEVTLWGEEVRTGGQTLAQP